MEILIILLLIVLNGIFSMSEIAMVSARKSKLEADAKSGDKNAKAALETAVSPNHFLSTVQIGITLIGILTGIFSGEKITDDLAAALEKIEPIKAYAQTFAVIIVVVILTFLSLVIGELVPKRIGLSNPERLAKVVARPMQLLTTIISPFVRLLTTTSDILIKLSGIKQFPDGKVTEEEIKAIIQAGTDGGAIREIEQDIVSRVFSLGDRKVSSLMTHRSNTVSLKLHLSAKEVQEIVNTELHSVYPVIDSKEDVSGIILLKDLFRNINKHGFKLEDYLHDPQYIVENASAYRALQQFKTSQIHNAIVVDEYGQMQGIITMNDLLEALVGDVSDFYEGDFTFFQRGDGSWLIDGQFPFAEFLRKFDRHEANSDNSFNTLSGLILDQLGNIPSVGDKIYWLDFQIEIVDMDGVRIDKVLVIDKKK